MQLISNFLATSPSEGANPVNANAGRVAAADPASSLRGAESRPRGQTNYTIKEAAAYLRVCQKTVRNLISRKLLRTSKVLRHIRIPGEDVENLFAQTS